MKFEEDIKPPFQALYSHSSSIVIGNDVAIDTLTSIGKLHPGLEKSVETFPKDEKLVQVGDFTAFAQVLKGTSFKIRKDPETDAECSLTLWYAAEDDAQPIVAEFSVKYDDDKENYSGKMARRAYDSFMGIQDQLKAWIDGKAMTKTAYVYALKK